MNEIQPTLDPDSMLKTAQSCARIGELSKAEELLEQIRSSIKVEAYPSLIIGIMVVEGCIYAYRADWKNSRDRLTRAQALAAAQRKLGLELEATAWLAYVAFSQGKLDEACAKSTQVLRWRDQADAFTLYRAASVVSFLYFLADAPANAAMWLQFAKRMAELAGAAGAISSLIFASAALRASSERVRLSTGKEASVDLDLELLLSRSAQNYDAISAVKILPALHKLQEAQVLNMMGEFLTASILLKTLLETAGDLPWISAVQARLELLWSLWSMDSGSIEKVALLDGVENLKKLSEDDDRVVYASRLMAISQAAGHDDIVTDLQIIFNEAKYRFDNDQKAILNNLSQGLTLAGLPSDCDLNKLMLELGRTVASDSAIGKTV